jgi:hypothetical protein
MCEQKQVIRGQSYKRNVPSATSLPLQLPAVLHNNEKKKKKSVKALSLFYTSHHCSLATVPLTYAGARKRPGAANNSPWIL